MRDPGWLGDPLFGFPGMIIRRMKPLDHQKPGMGTAILLHMPTITVWLPRAIASVARTCIPS
ncbi:hypothetical protein [Sphingomonas mollis]|uniref:hypothetical protein n=1 Tax=Sphingomonas mollis TaxID=2795726 RepID=UPI0018EDAD4A|nr:hypothetical protein [Sphingomonas sp. BT553]